MWEWGGVSYRPRPFRGLDLVILHYFPKSSSGLRRSLMGQVSFLSAEVLEGHREKGTWSSLLNRYTNKHTSYQTPKDEWLPTTKKQTEKEGRRWTLLWPPLYQLGRGKHTRKWRSNSLVPRHHKGSGPVSEEVQTGNPISLSKFLLRRVD